MGEPGHVEYSQLRVVHLSSLDNKKRSSKLSDFGERLL